MVFRVISTWVRQFGLQRHDLPSMIENVAVLLKLFALNIDTRNTKGIPFICYIISIIIVFNYFYVYLVSTWWFIFWRTDTYDQLEKILFFALSISSMISVTKLFSMFANRNKIKKIINGYLLCDSQVVPNSRMSRNLLKTLRVVKKRAMVFWLVIMANGFVYCLIPQLKPGRHLTEDNQKILGLEPMFESPNYEICLVMLILGPFITVYTPANITGFLIIISGYTEAQMIAQSQELLNLWNDANKHTHANDKQRNEMINVYIKDRLRYIIRSHANQINLIGEVDGVFKVGIAVEFVLLSIGLIADLLGGLENTYMAVPFAMVVVSMDCFTGQRLIDAHEIFRDAVYNCNWENFDASNMKLVMVMQLNALKTNKLSAGGIASLSYGSFMSVIKSIYSAFTALRSTMND